MHIEFDYDFGPGGAIVARHFIETTPGGQFQVTVPSIQAAPLDVIQYIKALHAATVPVVGTGWDAITKHPTYPGQTRLAALIGEIIRLNDTPSRTVLGI